jgi:hypothetical protein
MWLVDERRMRALGSWSTHRKARRSFRPALFQVVVRRPRIARSDRFFFPRGLSSSHGSEPDLQSCPYTEVEAIMRVRLPRRDVRAEAQAADWGPGRLGALRSMFSDLCTLTPSLFRRRPNVRLSDKWVRSPRRPGVPELPTHARSAETYWTCFTRTPDGRTSQTR